MKERVAVLRAEERWAVGWEPVVPIAVKTTPEFCVTSATFDRVKIALS